MDTKSREVEAGDSRPVCDVCKSRDAKYQGTDGTKYCEECSADEEVVLIAAGVVALNLMDGEFGLFGLL